MQGNIIHWVLVLQKLAQHNRNHKLSQNTFLNSMELIKQLEDNSTEINLATIDQLEILAETQPKYYWKIIKSLSNVIRRNSVTSLQNHSVLKIKDRQVIQAAITLMSQLVPVKGWENKQIDLSYTDLREINLSGANLKNVNFYQANLQGANLSGANLQEAILVTANLCDANLILTNLSGAILSAAKLNGANLHKANLYLANLHGANLDDANLSGANLRETILDPQLS